MFEERIVFMGSSLMSIDYLNFLLKNNFNVIGVFTQPPRKQGRGMKIKKSAIHDLSLSKNIPIYNPINFKLRKDINQFQELRPDIAIVISYGLVLPKEILNIPKYGCINIHFSLLPRWRGASPIEHAILNGDKKTGITIFQIQEKLDSGPVIISEAINIRDSYSKDELTFRLNKIGINLLSKILPRIFGNKLSKRQQDESKATYAKKITSEFRKINFYNNANTVYHHIRAFSPKPSAWFIYNKQRINIISCSMEECSSKAATIINDKFHIGCLNGKIIPKIIQREGKKPMALKEFLKGFKFVIGDKVNA